MINAMKQLKNVNYQVFWLKYIFLINFEFIIATQEDEQMFRKRC